MTYLNPLAASLPQAAQAQGQLAAAKAKQVRRSQALSRDSGVESDRLEHQVESSESVASVHDDDPRRQQSKKRESPPTRPAGDEETGDPPRLDVTA